MEIGTPTVATADVAMQEKRSLLKVAGERYGVLLELLKKGVEVERELAYDQSKIENGGGQKSKIDVAFVHDLRVAARRLSEVAAILAGGGLMDKPTSRMVDATLKGLRKAAGELRDLDVTCEHLQLGERRGKWAMPAALKTVAKELGGELQGKRSELEKKLRETMTSAGVTGAMVLLARTIEVASAPEQAEGGGVERQLRAAVEKRLAKRQKRMRKKYGTAAQKQTDESLHEARIATKQLRYVVELADAGGIKRQKTELKFLKNVQELLGDHHDVHVILSTLATRVAAKGRTVKGLGVAWRKWQRIKEWEQGKRAAEFFVQSYRWMRGL